MRDFPWLEAALFIALAIALIVKPAKQQVQPPSSQSAYSALLAH
jgi:hypothetical protein